MIKNKYKVIDDYVVLYCDRKNNEIFEVYIDLDDLKIIDRLDYKIYVKLFKRSRSYYAGITLYEKDEIEKTYVKCVLLHRFLLDIKDPKVKVDHINHNTLNNRRTNLRTCNNSNNNRHREGKNSNNKSGYRNVCWSKRDNQWMVQLMVDGKNTRLGYFDDIDEAGKFAEDMRAKYYGEFAGEN